MKPEREPVADLERYNDYDEIKDDFAFLEESGFHPRIHEEPAAIETGASLFVLQSPESEYDSAYTVLVQRWEEQAQSENEVQEDD